jgi:hypothetical protein
LFEDAVGEQFEGVLAAARTGAEWAVTALYREFHDMQFPD